MRVAGQDSRPPPTPCPFPDHEAGCANAPLAAGLHLEEMCEGAPVLVIERENDKVSMRLLFVMLADLGVTRAFIRGLQADQLASFKRPGRLFVLSLSL